MQVRPSKKKNRVSSAEYVFIAFNGREKTMATRWVEFNQDDSKDIMNERSARIRQVAKWTYCYYQFLV